MSKPLPSSPTHGIYANVHRHKQVKCPSVGKWVNRICILQMWQAGLACIDAPKSGRLYQNVLKFLPLENLTWNWVVIKVDFMPICMNDSRNSSSQFFREQQHGASKYWSIFCHEPATTPWTICFLITHMETLCHHRFLAWSFLWSKEKHFPWNLLSFVKFLFIAPNNYFRWN